MKSILILALGLFSLSANAYTDKHFVLKDVENYMSNLKSFSADFEQIVPGEDISKGTLYVSKPGRFLWQYKFPQPVKIVANGGLVYFVDEEAGQVTQVPDTGILFSLLSKSNIKLNNDTLTVTQFSQDNNRITINISAKMEDETIPVKLIIKKVDDNNLELMKIVSKNQIDQMVVISLMNHNNNAVIEKSIFKVDGIDEF